MTNGITKVLSLGFDWVTYYCWFTYCPISV